MQEISCFFRWEAQTRKIRAVQYSIGTLAGGTVPVPVPVPYGTVPYVLRYRYGTVVVVVAGLSCITAVDRLLDFAASWHVSDWEAGQSGNEELKHVLPHARTIRFLHTSV